MPSAFFDLAYSDSRVVVGAIRPVSAPIASSWSMTNSRSTLGHGRQTGQLTLKLPTLSDLVVVPREVVWGMAWVDGRVRRAPTAESHPSVRPTARPRIFSDLGQRSCLRNPSCRRIANNGRGRPLSACWSDHCGVWQR